MRRRMNSMRQRMRAMTRRLCTTHFGSGSRACPLPHSLCRFCRCLYLYFCTSRCQYLYFCTSTCGIPSAASAGVCICTFVLRCQYLYFCTIVTQALLYSYIDEKEERGSSGWRNRRRRRGGPKGHIRGSICWHSVSICTFVLVKQVHEAAGGLGGEGRRGGASGHLSGSICASRCERTLIYSRSLRPHALVA
jgi:hypothetical protein